MLTRKLKYIFTLIVCTTILNSQSFGYVSKRDDDLAGWASRSMVNLFTYNYKNAQTHFKDNIHLFTKTGWEQFLTLLKKSDGLDMVIDNKMYSYASLIMPSEIVNMRDTDEARIYKVNVSLSSCYSKVSSSEKAKEIAEDFIIELIITESTSKPRQIIAINKVAVPYPELDNL